MFWRRIILAISVCLNLILLYSLIWGQDGAFAYKELKNECAMLEKRIKDLDVSNQTLTKEIHMLQTDEQFLERMIRLKLNFVRDNEILYIFHETGNDIVEGASSDETKN